MGNGAQEIEMLLFRVKARKGGEGEKDFGDGKEFSIGAESVAFYMLGMLEEGIGFTRRVLPSEDGAQLNLRKDGIEERAYRFKNYGTGEEFAAGFRFEFEDGERNVLKISVDPKVEGREERERIMGLFEEGIRGMNFGRNIFLKQLTFSTCVRYYGKRPCMGAKLGGINTAIKK